MLTAKTKVQAAMTAVLLSVNPDHALLLKISNYSMFEKQMIILFSKFHQLENRNHEQGTLLYQRTRDEKHIPMKPRLLVQV